MVKLGQEFIARFRSPGPETWAAISALGNDSSNDAVVIHSDLAHHPDWRYRRSATESLSNHPSPTSASALFDAWLADPLPRHRIWACELARTYGDEVTKSRLQPLMQDSDGHVRKSARNAVDAD